MIAVVGATGTADVVRVLRWAAEYGVEVVVLGAGGEQEPSPGTARSSRSRSRAPTGSSPIPARAPSGPGSARRGRAVHRAAATVVARPSVTLVRADTVAGAVGQTTLRGATVVTGDGVAHTAARAGRLPPSCGGPSGPDPGAVGLVTAVVLDVGDTATVLPRRRMTSEQRFRLVHLARRHDPAGLLGVPAGGAVRPRRAPAARG